MARAKAELAPLYDSSSLTSVLKDLVALTKPRITLMVLLTAAGGMWLSPVSISPRKLVFALVGLALIVGAANSLNCFIERDLDRLMARTKNRPLPAGRLSPSLAATFGIVLAVIALPLLTLGVNPLTGLLGAVAFGSYVAIYTPLKTLSPTALLVGAVPGAMPPLMGWTSASDSIDMPALCLFGVLFLWQLPHSIAISSFRCKEYEAAGMKVLPAVRGDRVARVHASFWAVLIIPVSLALVAYGVAGWLYGAAALLMGVVYAGATLAGLAKNPHPKWARRVFFVSLVYLPVVFTALMLDAA